MNQNFVLLFTFLVCHEIIFLRDGIAVCVTIAFIMVTADKRLINSISLK